MHLQTRGLILKEQSIGERDKLITVLTEDRGVLRAFVRGAKAVKSKKQAATTKFCYAHLRLATTRDSYIVEEAQCIEQFFALRDNIEKLALAEYFLELGFVFAPPEEDAHELLRVLLNSMYMLANGKRPPLFLKAVTELRVLTISGYAPNLVACERCGTFETPTMYFDMEQGLLYCENCAPATAPFALPLGVVSAMRHIVFSPLRALYNFALDADLLEELSYITETCLLRQAQHTFKTLEFYRAVCMPQNKENTT